MRPSFTLRAVAAACLCIGAASANAVPQDTTTSFEYDNLGNVIKVTDPLLHASSFAYDPLNRRVLATDAKLKTVKYGYDALDQLIQVTDQNNVVTAYTVDGLGKQTQLSSQDTGTTVRTFDAAGNMLSSRDAKNQTTTYQYDALNRITRIQYSDLSTVTYLYDAGPNAIGCLSKITDSSGSTAYSYDSFGRATAEVRTIGAQIHTTGYRYDDAGRLAGMTYPSGRKIDYARDPLGRISSIATSAGGAAVPLVQQVSYQPFGGVQAVTFGNGRTQARSFDLDGRIDSFSLPAQTMSIKYDAASRITGIADAANPATGNTYGYDQLDRLTNFATPSLGQTFAYDAVGNRTQKVINGTASNNTYAGPGNRLTQAGAQAITTDSNGSITNRGNATFNYDARGRMVSANTAIGLVTYTINSLGQRVRKVTPTETTLFHYDMAGKLIAETTTAGAVTRTQEYVYLGDMPVAVLK